ncbi:response regulator [Agromyces sp. H3Y2-19a]|uniref:response regulator n=1 Tax=Agromyces TaxID=33877 RepID=UPI001E517F95|nr:MULTISPECIES: response regulator [Agromyces]MCD5348179.1 response regulator [Agromyces sp. S2-1-8]MDF0514216.1 response regulator [Agromyces chromiiresistens]
MTADVRVLVVDDDFRVAGIHHDLVSARPGFEALPPVRDIASARTAIRDWRPELLLVDVYLPDGDGIELARESGLDRFVLSAANDAATVRRALRSGALHYLVKPFEARTLQERLDGYLRYRNLLAVESPLAQDTIDRALGVLHGAAPTSSRSGTQQLILDALADGGEASSVEVAERAGVSRATAQRHLAELAARGAVTVSLRYGSAGRPEHRYRSGSS